jgi:hypothetical protein
MSPIFSRADKSSQREEGEVGGLFGTSILLASSVVNMTMLPNLYWCLLDEMNILVAGGNYYSSISCMAQSHLRQPVAHAPSC